MKRFEVNKVMLESSTAPKDINTLWVDVDENTKEVLTIKQFINGEWKVILSKDSGIKIPMIKIIREGSSYTYEDEYIPEELYRVLDTSEQFFKNYPVGIDAGPILYSDDFIFYGTLAKVCNENVGNTLNIIISIPGFSITISKEYDPDTQSWGEWEESPLN